MNAMTDSEETGSRRSRAQERSRAQTRQRLLESADALFRDRGYTATTVTAIVAGAEVSLQTLYLTWGSKRALFRAAADAAATTSAEPPTPERWHEMVEERITRLAGEDGTARAHITAIVEVFVQLAQHAGTYWRLYEQAAAAEPDIAEEWRSVIARRRETCTVLAALIPQDGLRDDLDRATIADTIWAVASPATYLTLVDDGSYDETRVLTWLTTTLTNALCTPDEEVPPPPADRSLVRTPDQAARTGRSG